MIAQTIFYTGNGTKFKVSPEDAEFVMSQKWTAYTFRTKYGEYTYVGRRRRPGRNSPKIHIQRLIAARMVPEVGEIVLNGRFTIDHVNGDTLDNRRENLRLVGYSQNRQNCKRLDQRNSSGYQGVHWNTARGQWVARLRIQKRDYFLGYFDNSEEAALAYDRKAREQGCVRLNFPTT